LNRKEKIKVEGSGRFQVFQLRPQTLRLLAELSPLGSQNGLILHPVFSIFHQDRPPFVVLVERLAGQLLVAGLNPLFAGGDLVFQPGDVPFKTCQRLGELPPLFKGTGLAGS